ncbi:MAG: hypothetical protein ACLVJ6_03375 [Merdibacter sp.]
MFDQLPQPASLLEKVQLLTPSSASICVRSASRCSSSRPGADRRLYLKILFDIVRKAVDVSGYQHQKSDDQQRHRDGRR